MGGCFGVVLQLKKGGKKSSVFGFLDVQMTQTLKGEKTGTAEGKTWKIVSPKNPAMCGCSKVNMLKNFILIYI